MKYVFLAHPIAGNVEANLEDAAKWVRWATLKNGIVPLAPYFQSLAAFSDHSPIDRKIGHSHGLKVLQICQELWVCGEQITRGMQDEIDAALRWRIPVIYLEEMK